MGAGTGGGPAAYGDQSARIDGADRVHKGVLGYQHPLAIYDTLLTDAVA